MSTGPETSSPEPRRAGRAPWNTIVGVAIVIVVVVSLSASVIFALSYKNGSAPNTLPTTPNPHFAIGTRDASEPSGFAPPPATVSGYSSVYVADFNGSTLPPGWNVYSGHPGGDPGAQFGIRHVVVEHGLLELNTWKDPQYQNRWVTGGLCQCGLDRKYGAYYVRSRVTGPGPNSVELLWPSDNSWPPEIDFNENGGKIDSTSATIHWSPIDQIEQRHLVINMLKWHTWGVIWTPSSVTFVVDGYVWGKITNAEEVTHRAMNLDLQQVAMCNLGRQCPTHRVSMLVDWVAEYKAT